MLLNDTIVFLANRVWVLGKNLLTLIMALEIGQSSTETHDHTQVAG